MDTNMKFMSENINFCRIYSIAYIATTTKRIDKIYIRQNIIDQKLNDIKTFDLKFSSRLLLTHFPQNKCHYETQFLAVRVQAINSLSVRARPEAKKG